MITETKTVDLLVKKKLQDCKNTISCIHSYNLASLPPSCPKPLYLFIFLKYLSVDRIETCITERIRNRLCLKAV